MEPTHEEKWEVCHIDDRDYEPWGRVRYDFPYSDCSCGCKWAWELDLDWVICMNPASHRCGLLTFEHQGCTHFECDETEEDIW